MILHLSIKAKLVVSTEAARELKPMMEECNRVCNLLSDLTYQQDWHRKYDILRAGYASVRAETSLPSQHVINAIAKVGAACARQQQKLHRFKPHSSVRGAEPLRHKTRKEGVEVVFDEPAYTSQMCHRCLHPGQLLNQSTFVCSRCGGYNADLNASKSIAFRYDLIAMGRFFCEYFAEVCQSSRSGSSPKEREYET